MEHQPTLDQEKVINYDGNSVVIAKPGTGKTLTLAYKIRKILADLPYYKGVIAISYTNKASDELQNRSLGTGVERKDSFFGTTDKFFLSEIIMPFGERVFGKPIQELSVLKFSELDASKYSRYDNEKSDAENFTFFSSIFRDGWIVLETIGKLALYIIENSVACQRYLKARFSHIIVDEYQDYGERQHQVFMKLVSLGVVGIAVGDIDQSIFGYDGDKSSKYLSHLATLTEQYKTFSLVENHRCHLSIVNYSARLLSPTFEVQPAEEIRVFEKNVAGSDAETAKWLSNFIPSFSKQFGVTSLNRVGVLFRNNITGNLINQNLSIPHKLRVTTSLDEDSSFWGGVFRKVLNWIFNPELTKYELVEHFLNFDFQEKSVRKVMSILHELENNVMPDRLYTHINRFINIAEILFPLARNQNAINNLTAVLNTSFLLSSYMPAKDNEVQLLTIHKSKGLEFDIVFHLNLHKWILPKYKGDYYQDLNLHYVGITRAKKCCVLCTSSHRQKDANEIKKAEPSDFLEMNGLEKLRMILP